MRHERRAIMGMEGMMDESDVLLPDVAKRFDLTISDHPNLFGDVPAVEPSALLRDTL
jgi:hypothetical protein